MQHAAGPLAQCRSRLYVAVAKAATEQRASSAESLQYRDSPGEGPATIDWVHAQVAHGVSLYNRARREGGVQSGRSYLRGSFDFATAAILLCTPQL